MKSSFRVMVGVLALAVSGYAAAVPVNFEIGAGSDVHLTSYDPLFGSKPTLTLNPLLSTFGDELSAGDTWDFSFFTISLPAFGAGEGTVSASLDFEKPLGAPDATGTAAGGFFSAFIISAGELLWTTQPSSVTLADGTSYSVFFQNVKGITFGTSADVRAYLTLKTEPVPEPGTLALLGLGLVGAGLMNRRRLARKKAG